MTVVINNRIFERCVNCADLNSKLDTFKKGTVFILDFDTNKDPACWDNIILTLRELNVCFSGSSEMVCLVESFEDLKQAVSEKPKNSFMRRFFRCTTELTPSEMIDIENRAASVGDVIICEGTMALSYNGRDPYCSVDVIYTHEAQEEISQFPKSITVAKLKQIIKDWPETRADGEPCEVRIGAPGKNRPVFCVEPINCRSDKDHESADILFGDGRTEA